MTSYATQRARSPVLQRIGTWATWWWAITGLYAVLLMWRATHFYSQSGFSFSAWGTAIGTAFTNAWYMPMLLALVATGWVAGGYVWLQELKRQKIKYRVAFKDLFLTIRK